MGQLWLDGPPSDPPVNISRLVELPSLGQHALPPLLPIEAHGYYRAWVRPLPPRAASRLSGLVRRLPASSLNSVLVMCRADYGQGLGHTLQIDHTTHRVA